MQKRIITLSGLPGTGKSSTARGVADALHYTRFSSGDFMRQLGTDRGMTIDQMQLAAEADPSIDEAIDSALRAKNEESDLVIDSRIAFHWLPESFKVLLTLDPKVAAHRTYKQIHQSNERLNQEAADEAEIYKNILRRIESEKLRYKKLYNIDYPTPSDFDLVIDTENHPLSEVIAMVLEAYSAWLSQ
ncbi:MAG: putative cytidylate kinase [Candidatus Adlerbacteria bacterium]|nr:putative cytidylate kinase [Candidatus Adlerbacteria bacterium]